MASSMRPTGASLTRRTDILAFDFPTGSLLLTEAGSKHRASLHLVSGRAQLASFERGGVDVLQVTPEALGAALRRQSRTLKRALTDPTIVDGIGNAYSDEILHRARLSPFALTGQPERCGGFEAAQDGHSGPRRVDHPSTGGGGIWIT